MITCIYRQANNLNPKKLLQNSLFMRKPHMYIALLCMDKHGLESVDELPVSIMRCPVYS